MLYFLSSYRNVFLALIFCFWSSAYANSNKITTKSLDSSAISELIEFIDQDSLVVISIENTLISPIFENEEYRQKINLYRANYNSATGYKSFLEEYYLNRKTELTHSSWPEIINKFKNKGAQVYLIYGNLEFKIAGFEKTIYMDLKSKNIEITELINGQNSMLLNRAMDWSAIFVKGTIFTAHMGKSKSLFSLVRTLQKQPKKFIYIDDKEKDIVYVENMLRRFKMKSRFVHLTK